MVVCPRVRGLRMRPLKGSVRGKIMTWSFVPTAVILIAVAVASLYAYQRFSEDLVIQPDPELTRLSARLLATELSAHSDPSSDLCYTGS